MTAPILFQVAEPFLAELLAQPYAVLMDQYDSHTTADISIYDYLRSGIMLPDGDEFLGCPKSAGLHYRRMAYRGHLHRVTYKQVSDAKKYLEKNLLRILSATENDLYDWEMLEMKRKDDQEMIRKALRIAS
jgi:uncharacterized C2H2 Zn-finger protein